MLNFFIKFIIVIIALIVCVGFSSAVFTVPLVFPIVFVCSWTFIKSFKNNMWGIITFAVIYDFILSSRVGLYFLIIIGFSLIFNFINYSIFEVSGKRIILAYIGISLLTLILLLSNFALASEKIEIIILIKQIFSYISVSLILFFIFSKLISYLENIIYFYTQRIDIKRHI